MLLLLSKSHKEIVHLRDRPELETEVCSSEASRSVCILFGYVKL